MRLSVHCAHPRLLLLSAGRFSSFFTSFLHARFSSSSLVFFSSFCRVFVFLPKAVRVRNNLHLISRFFCVSSIVPGNAIINLGARARVTFIRK